VETSPGPDQFDDGADHGDIQANGAAADPSGGETGSNPEGSSDESDPTGADPTGAQTTGAHTTGDDTTGDDSRDPLRFNRWMKRSATGAVMTGIAVGLQQALELPKQEPAFVIEASGEPDDPDRPIDLRFDPDSPADTVAVIRRRAVVDPPVADPSSEDQPEPSTS
jgi:hypothetical protein